MNCKRKIAKVCVAAMLLFAAVPFAAHAEEGEVIEGASLTIDGESAALGAPVRIEDGRLFLPAAAVAASFGAAVEWNPEYRELTIHTANGDRIVMSDGVPVVYMNETRYVMDEAPFLHDDRIYVPLRYAAGILGADVSWNAEAGSVQLTTVESTEEIIAAFFRPADPYSEEEYRLLAKLVQVEAGHESYDGQLAVANVILNRVNDSRFPDSIRDVIYSGKQFPPAHNGLLDKSEPNEGVLRATKDALNGKNNVAGALYFFNPKVSRGSYWDSMDVVATFGNHAFAK